MNLHDAMEHHWSELASIVAGLPPDEQAEAINELRLRLGDLRQSSRKHCAGLLFIPEAKPAAVAAPSWDEFIAHWNSQAGIAHVRASTPQRLKWFRECCRQKAFREGWREAVEKAPLKASSDGSWKPELTWFLTREGWVKSLEATDIKTRSKHEQRIDTQADILREWAAAKSQSGSVGALPDLAGRIEANDGAIELATDRNLVSGPEGIPIRGR